MYLSLNSNIKAEDGRLPAVFWRGRLCWHLTKFAEHRQLCHSCETVCVAMPMQETALGCCPCGGSTTGTRWDLFKGALVWKHFFGGWNPHSVCLVPYPLFEGWMQSVWSVHDCGSVMWSQMLFPAFLLDLSYLLFSLICSCLSVWSQPCSLKVNTLLP